MGFAIEWLLLAELSLMTNAREPCSSLVGLTRMPEPTGLVAPARVMVGPVNDATFCIPLVYAIEGNQIPCPQCRNSGSQIDVMRNENGLAGGQCEDKALMTTSVIIVSKKLGNYAFALNLYAALLFIER